MLYSKYHKKRDSLVESLFIPFVVQTLFWKGIFAGKKEHLVWYGRGRVLELYFKALFALDIKDKLPFSI